jgi:hypothetical protein
MPSGVELESVDLDGKAILPTTLKTTGDTFVLPLPTTFECGLLTLELRSEHLPLAQRKAISSPLPISDMPVLAGQWTIWLPAEFMAIGDALDPTANEFNWQQRLLGPLAWLCGQPINGWARSPGGAVSPQEVSGAVKGDASAQLKLFETSPLDSNGWRSFHTSFAATPPEPVRVVDISWANAMSASVFLLSLFAASISRMPGKPFILLAAGAAVLALCLPSNIAPLAASAFWGLFISPICRRAFARAVVNQTATGGSQIVSRQRIELASLAIGTALVFGQSGVCAQPSGEGAAAKDVAAIHSVLVPVDTQGQAAGTKYFVDEEFVRQLLEKAAAKKRSAGGSWLLAKMRCEGKLPARSDERSAAASSWTITLEIETFSQDTFVTLPLIKSQAVWPATASLDGIPMPIVWGANGDGCSIVAAEPGRHHLTIQFEPATHESNGTHKFELGLPPLAGAEFRATYPSSMTSVEISGGQFDTHFVPAGTEKAGELDGTGCLVAAWVDPSAVGNNAESVRVDELSWLRIERDGVELNVKYVLLGGGSPDALAFVADRRWQCLPATPGQSEPESEPLAGGKQSIRALVPTGNEGRRVVTMRLSLRDAVPPGQLRLPSFELTSLPVASRQMVVSSDPAWECEAAGGATVAGGTSAADDFMAAWGSSEAEPPQIVLNTAQCRPGWFLVLRPRAVDSKSDERLTITAGRDRVKLRYEANVQPQGVHRFRWSLFVPETLTIDNVSVDGDGQPVAIDFVRAGPDRVNVFFDAAVENPFRLVLKGSIPLTGSGECLLPRITAADRPVARQIISIYHDENVTMKPPRLEAIGPLDQGVVEAPDKSGRRFVGTYVIDRVASDDVRLLIEPMTAEPKSPQAKTELPLAAPHPRSDESSPPSVRLAQTTLCIAPAGAWYTVTRFVIAPHGLTQCVLQLPENQRLMQTKLDGHIALVQQIDNQNWRVQLGPPALPQTLAIVSRGVGHLDAAARFVTLGRPFLRIAENPISVEVSLWSISKPTSASSPRAAGAALVEPLEAAVLRLDRLTSIAESATPAAMEAPADDVFNWFVPRASELLSAQRAVQALNTQSSNVASSTPRVHAEDDPAALAVARSAGWIAHVEELATAAKIGEPKAADRATNPPDASLREPVPGCTTTSFVSESGDNRLSIEFVPVGLTAGKTRAILLAIVICVAGLSLRFSGRPRAAPKAIDSEPQKNHQGTTV